MFNLEKIGENKKKIQELEAQKTEKREEHRDATIGLKELGVKKNVSGILEKSEPSDDMKKALEERGTSVMAGERYENPKRSETFSGVLGPIEKEIDDISDQISEIKKDSDFHETNKEIWAKRSERLEYIKHSAVKEFLLTTDSGKQINDMIKANNSTELTAPEVYEKLKTILNTNQNYNGKKDVKNFWDTIKRIDGLKTRISENMRNDNYGESKKIV
ncbi:MAG: hypothetical protein WDK96_01250 [Candidatus Paceibacterota bacterium]|jgi:hypothetical protein